MHFYNTKASNKDGRWKEIKLAEMQDSVIIYNNHETKFLELFFLSNWKFYPDPQLLIL